EDGEEVDVHMCRSMIGSLMYLTSSRPDIIFAVCACARYQVNLKVSHLCAMKKIFRASMDRKSTTGGCQFLRSRLISWQCKKQTMVTNSTTKAEYVAALSCCGDCNEKKLIQMVKIHTDKNVVDLLTKAFDVKTVNGEVQLQALVDGKKIIITEASVRRDLQINDEEGTDFLPNATIFKELTRMGPYTPTMVTTPAVVPQQRILTVIPAKHQSRQTAQEMRKPSRVQQGESLNIQDVKTNLFWEFGQFTSHDGETIESYYTRFYKMMNEMIRNNLTVATMQVNVQFPFNNFKPNGQDLSHCEATTQLDEVSYHKLFRHSETIPKGSIMNTVLKRMAKNAKPISTLSHAATRHKGKEIAKTITPPSESASEEDSDPEQAQKDKDMQKNLALIAKCAGVNKLRKAFNFKQSNLTDWLADTDEEIDEQELEAHYSYMAKIQEVPNADSGTDAEPLEQVHYDTDHNVFANDLQHLSNLNLISNHEHGNG
ncbi:hypothetical protein Tco_1083144, partial [Tanacetum coccineum]